MMRFSSSYVFRALVPMVLGIASADVLTRWVPPATVAGWGFGFLAATVGVVVLLILYIKYHKEGFPTGFGLILGLLFLLVGADLYLYQYRATYVEWPTKDTAFRAVVYDRPVQKKRHLRCPAEVGPHRVLIYLPDDSLSRTLQRGDELRCYGRITYADTSRYARIFFHQGISGSAFLRAGHWQPTGRRHPLTLRQRALACRDHIVNIYRRWGFEGDALGILSALTVGQTDELSTELRGSFSGAGISHVLALSGLHVGLIWGILASLLPSFATRRKLRFLRLAVIASVLTGYVFLAGAPPSAVRAVLLFVIIEMNECLSPEYTPRMHALIAVVFLLLLCNPFYLFQLSFQLSVLAVGGILAYYEPIHDRLRERFKYHTSWLNFLIVPVLAQVAVAPLSLYYFNTFPVYFLLSSLLAVWMAEAIVYGALAVLAMGILIPVLEPLGIGILKAMTGGLIAWAEWVNRLPHALWRIDGLSGYEVAYLYLFLILCYKGLMRPTLRLGIWVFLAFDGALAILLFR